MKAPDRELDQSARGSWRQFLDVYEPLRGDLYRYCRHLTRSPWDAEDMAQDTLARAFVTLACMREPPLHPRAWLFRVASNLWINRARRAREALTRDGTTPNVSEGTEPRATREAAGTLLAQLSPQERAAVVLKDAFDFSLEEIAETLSTTAGAVKAALHRGRGKLVDPVPSEPNPVTPAALDAFCAAFNARDLKRLTALLLDATTVEYPGLIVETGQRAAESGSIRGTLFGCPDGAYDASVPPRCEVRGYRGEPILLWWWGDEVHAVLRVELDGERIVRIQNYYHAPELMTEVCGELGVPFRTFGHRYWLSGGDV
jgi:RNA polymerase sigma-70 factor (ECF subfamily)